MTALHALAIVLAGVAAGTINTVVGSGTLITFPILLAFGYPARVANVSNNLGLVPAGVSGAIGLRSLLTGQRARIVPLALTSVAGGICGAVLLLVLPAAAFRTIVPFFIGLALVLIVVQRPLSRWIGAHRSGEGARVSPAALVGAFGSGVYGGYFGAAQGILLLAILSLAVDDALGRLNAVKVVLTFTVNLVAGVIFAVAAHVAWDAAGLIALGSLCGGVIGARFGRRLSPGALRVLIVVVGVVAIIRLA